MPVKKNLPPPLPPSLYDLTERDTKRFAEERALGMVAITDPVLNKIAQPVEPAQITSPEIQAVVARLMHVAKNQKHSNQKNKKRRTLVGLAAPQIGESLRIIVVDMNATPARNERGKLQCFINPEIIWRSRETAEDREGCFSAGLVWGMVRRPIVLKMRAFTPDGKQIERVFEDFTARIIQHERDHLDGIRFPERITTDRKRHWVHTEEFEIHKKLWRRWPRLCSREQWEALKKNGI